MVEPGSALTVAAPPEQRSLTAAQIRADVNLIQEVMAAVMKKDVHFGTIPGTLKPTLYKPGAEKILSTFRIAAADPSVEDLSSSDEIRYRLVVRGVHQVTEQFLGAGIGECSSSEEKYRWRKPVCPEEWTETTEDRRREVWKRGEGGKPYQLKQVRTNPADVANTILKMAHKRALVAMTLVVTAASDVFSQDIEDLPEEVREAVTEGPPQASTPTIQPPQRRSQAAVPQTTNGAWQAITSKFDGKCSGCGALMKAGTTIYYNRAEKSALCVSCHEAPTESL